MSKRTDYIEYLNYYRDENDNSINSITLLKKAINTYISSYQHKDTVCKACTSLKKLGYNICELIIIVPYL